MDNKGFTLIELLAVIVILGSIATLAVIGISASLERNDENECLQQQELAKNAAKIYFAINDSATKVCVYTLINKGYFSEKSKYDRLNYNNNDNTTNCKGIIDNNLEYTVNSGSICK